MLKEKLDKRPDLQEHLFRRAFIMSVTSLDDKLNEFPFYGNWKPTKLSDLHIYVHKTDIHIVECENVSMFLAGHCYNPFTMEHEEEKQLKRIGLSYGKEDFFDKINEITGIFVLGWIDKNGNVSIITDPSGMQSSYYGLIDGNFMITSHAQIL